MKTELAALRDELLRAADTEQRWMDGCPDRSQVNAWADRLTDLLGSLPPQEEMDVFLDFIADFKEVRPDAHKHLSLFESYKTLAILFDQIGSAHVDISKRGGGVKGMSIDERVSSLLDCLALGSLPVPDTEEPAAYTILVEREADAYFASWTTGDRKEGGCAPYSGTVVGALAELCATLLKVDEDTAVLSQQEQKDKCNCLIPSMPSSAGGCPIHDSRARQALEGSALLSRSAQEPEMTPKEELQEKVKLATPYVNQIVVESDGYPMEHSANAVRTLLVNAFIQGFDQAIARSRSAQEPPKEEPIK